MNVAAARAEEKAAAEAQRAMVAAAQARGTTAAQQDAGRDVLKLKEYPPLPAPAWHQKYVALLKERCNVEWEVVQGPADSVALREEVIAYNAVMRAEIERRFGADILLKLQIEAEGKK